MIRHLNEIFFLLKQNLRNEIIINKSLQFLLKERVLR